MKITEHFDSSEFDCKCGCGKANISKALVTKLEELYQYLSKLDTGVKCIVVTSGFRCPSYSVKVGGYSSDAHTQNIAADIICYRKDGSVYDVKTIAAIAEYLGFSGIGLMSGATHLDIRNKNNYINSHWFGDELTGENNIPTFKEYLPKVKTSEELIITLGGKKYKITEV